MTTALYQGIKYRRWLSQIFCGGCFRDLSFSVDMTPKTHSSLLAAIACLHSFVWNIEGAPAGVTPPVCLSREVTPAELRT